jgi:hypothetical protein
MIRNHNYWLVSVVALVFGARLSGQSTLATFSLTEAFGVQWPAQNLEMKYNGVYPNPRTTRLMRQDGTEMAYQWISGSDCWDYTAVNGCILVQDGLPAGSLSSPYTTTYTLQSTAPKASATNPVTITPGACVTGIAGWIIANGLGGFCVPRSQSAPYDAAPIQGLQLPDGSWTGGASGSPNLIYTNPTSTFLGVNSVQNSGANASQLRTVASTLFTGETTSFVEAGSLKTVVQLAYTGTVPAYYSSPGTMTATTASTVTLSNIYTDASMVIFYNAGGQQTLPANLQVDTVYYLSNCTNSSGVRSSSPSTCQLSTSLEGAPLTNIGTYNGTVNYAQIYNLASSPGHLTVTLTMYANTPGFMVEYDTNTVGQWFVPMFMESGHVFPNTRRYRADLSNSVACGYESPLTITNVTNATPPVVTVSGRLNATTGNQVTISGVQGATGVNGTFYICNPNQQNGTFQLYSGSACTGTSPAAGGAYSSGGIAKPIYTTWNTRNSRDAFYDITYTTSQIPGTTCSSTTIASLGVDDPPNWFGSGWYDLVYSSTAGSSAPVVGIFQGRMSKQFNTADPDAQFSKLTGWYASNSHWITNAQAFGLNVATSMDNASPITHSQFGVYIGTVSQLNAPDNMQPIGLLQAQMAGPNLSSMYAYTLCGPTSCYSDPSNGWQYPFYSSTDLAALQTWLGNSTNYNNMVNSAGGSSAAAASVYQLWNGLAGSSPSTAATSSFNTIMNFAGNITGIGYQVSTATYTGTGPYTVTATIGPHALLVGNTVGVTFNNQASWNCSSCTVSAVTPTTFSYTLSTAPSGAAGYGSVKQTGLASIVNDIANGSGRWTQGYYGYMLFQSSFDNIIPVCTALLHSGFLTTSQSQMCKSILALGGSLIWDEDWSCIGLDTTNAILATASCSGANLGLSNQNQLYRAYRSLAADTLYFHPYLSTKVNTANNYITSNLSGVFNQYGAGPASLHYQANYTEPNYQNFQAGALNGQLSFSNPQYNWKQHVQWWLSAVTPPEPRFGNLRKCLSDGDGNTEAACSGNPGGIAEGIYSTNSTTSGYAQWIWTQMNPGSLFASVGVTPYTLDTYSSFTVNPLLPSITPSLVSYNFPGYWSAMRFGFSTPHETSVNFINGDFYSSGGHRHIDQGQVSIYAHNAPLAIDWNANLYYPETSAGYCHNRVTYDTDLGALTSWSDTTDLIICSTPSSGQTETGTASPSSSNSNFAAFQNSTQSKATFTYSGGNTWTRVVRTIAPDSTYPLVYVEDSFLTANGAADTSGKTLTWHLMAECTMTSTTTGNCDPVSTPVGNITPVYRNSTGCPLSEIPTQYPSNTDISGEAPYALSNGLQAFHFTGMQWPAHATNGINWDLWEIPSSGAAQFLLGHWSHGCNTSIETTEFYQTNKTNPDMGYGQTGGPFISTSNQMESQDILRIHDTGVFKTVIAPYRKSETPTRTFTSGSCSNGIGGTVYQMASGSEITCFNDSAMSFTNGTEQVLTTYDSSTQSAFGLTATGGAQELVNNGSGTITWTIEDITTGTRCITLPSGTWYASTPVQHANGQFCYYHGGGPQPTPAVLTFTQSQLTIHTVTLSYDAPPNAAQVAVQFGSGANYVAVANCSPRCSVSLEFPAGTYTEQHTFLDVNGNPITSSQPRSAAY